MNTLSGMYKAPEDLSQKRPVGEDAAEVPILLILVRMAVIVLLCRFRNRPLNRGVYTLRSSKRIGRAGVCRIHTVTDPHDGRVGVSYFACGPETPEPSDTDVVRAPEMDWF